MTSSPFKLARCRQRRSCGRGRAGAGAKGKSPALAVTGEGARGLLDVLLRVIPIAEEKRLERSRAKFRSARPALLPGPGIDHGGGARHRLADPARRRTHAAPGVIMLPDERGGVHLLDAHHIDIAREQRPLLIGRMVLGCAACWSAILCSCHGSRAGSVRRLRAGGGSYPGPSPSASPRAISGTSSLRWATRRGWGKRTG